MEWIRCEVCGAPAIRASFKSPGVRGRCGRCMNRGDDGMSRLWPHGVRLCDRCEVEALVAVWLSDRWLRLCRAHAGSLAGRLRAGTNNGGLTDVG